MRLQGKTLVVPGGASGIGEAVVRLAATEGPANVIIYDRNAEAGERLAAEVGGPCRFVRLDITDPSAIWEALAAEDERNEIDHAIICAGVVALAAFWAGVILRKRRSSTLQASFGGRRT